MDRWNNYLQSAVNGKQNREEKEENSTPSPAVEGREFVGLNYSYCLLASVTFFQVIAQLFPLVCPCREMTNLSHTGSTGSLWKENMWFGQGMSKSKFLLNDSDHFIGFHDK